jgi:hypothetical protein
LLGEIPGVPWSNSGSYKYLPSVHFGFWELDLGWVTCIYMHIISRYACVVLTINGWLKEKLCWAFSSCSTHLWKILVDQHWSLHCSKEGICSVTRYDWTKLRILWNILMYWGLTLNRSYLTGVIILVWNKYADRHIQTVTSYIWYAFPRCWVEGQNWWISIISTMKKATKFGTWNQDVPFVAHSWLQSCPS